MGITVGWGTGRGGMGGTLAHPVEVSRTFLSRTFQVIITLIMAVRLIVITDLKLFIEGTIVYYMQTRSILRGKNNLRQSTA